MELLIATTNLGKLREIQKILDQFSLYSLKDFNITKKSSETSETFEENAVQKSLFYSNIKRDLLVCAEDSGLEVAALNGQPGIYSARFNQENPSDNNNMIKLLKMLNEHQNRKARFVTTIALSQSGKLIKTFTGMVEGRISEAMTGNKGFGYDPIFYFPPLDKTFGQLKPEIKNQISHRNQAFQKLKSFLSCLNGI